MVKGLDWGWMGMDQVRQTGKEGMGKEKMSNKQKKREGRVLLRGYKNKKNKKRLLSDPILGIRKSFPLSLPLIVPLHFKNR